VRWPELNPDKAGTEGDSVRVARCEIEKLLYEARVENEQERLKAALRGTLLFITASLFRVSLVCLPNTNKMPDDP
jgi:hypothetical protein